MHNFKRALVPVLLLVLVITANMVLDYALIPYGYARVTMHNIDTGDYEDMIIGTSHGLCGIDPEVLETSTGRKTINCCMGGEYLRDSYYLVKEAGRKHKVKRVIYELDPVYWSSDDPQVAEFARLYQEMPASLNKVEYFAAKLFSADYRTTLFPWHNYKKAISSMKDTIAMKQSDVYKNYDVSPFVQVDQYYREDGFIYRNRVEGEKTQVDSGTQFHKNIVDENQKKYFKKLADYCKKQDIELIVVTTPIPEETQTQFQTNNDEANAYFTQLTEQYGLTYYDFNYMDVDFDRSMDSYADYEGHLYGDKATEFTELLASYL